jgi:Fe-S-cluster containining protein
VTAGPDPAAFPFRFRCRRSGNCCARPAGVVRVGDADVRAIAAHLGMAERAFRSRYVAAGGDRLAEGLGGRCPFLADGGEATCTIYPVRPHRCRTWPYWPELLASPELLAQARRTCPGLK